MKKLFCSIALVFGMCQVSHAQVLFNSGSATPINPAAATENLGAEPARARPKWRRIVRCRDGSRHSVRVCRRGHGGVR